MSDSPFAPLNDNKPNGHAPAVDKLEWLFSLLVPADAPKPPARHSTLGAPSSIFAYKTLAGAVVCLACRFETKGGKEFRICALYRSAKSGAFLWRWEAPPAPRLIYALDQLAARPDAPVLIVEGEKAAAAAQRLLPHFVVTTSMCGAKSAKKSDWAPLCGRVVALWPDCDKAGLAYAKDAAALVRDAGAKSVAIITPPAGKPGGWDAADAEGEGWTPQQAAALVAAAQPDDRTSESDAPEGDDKGETKKRPRQRDQLMELCADVELWHAPDFEAYATITIGAHRENHPVRSAAFKRWLSLQFYDATGGALGGQTLEDTLRILEAKASQGAEKVPFLRVGSAADGKVIINMGDAAWRVIEIGPFGYTIRADHDYPIIRSKRTRPLCEPEDGYAIDELRAFINVSSGDDCILIIAWLVAALRPRGPYPLIALTGEQGTGKSFLSRLLRSLVDPTDPETQSPPRDERDLIVAAQNTHLLFFENLSHIDQLLSDALCRIATGAGFATRQLHTDREENLFSGARPIGINAIPDIAERPDLADRTIAVRLVPISDDQRRTEAELEEAWHVARPRILGALFTAVSAALRRSKNVKLARTGRMADFETWIAAAEAGLGWEAGTFAAAYERNRREASAALFETDVIAVAIADLLHEDHPRGWAGTATQLLTLLSGKVSDALKRSKAWPATPKSLGNHIKRIAPILRQNGIALRKGKSGGERFIVLAPHPTADQPPQSAAQPQEKS